MLRVMERDLEGFGKKLETTQMLELGGNCKSTGTDPSGNLKESGNLESGD